MENRETGDRRETEEEEKDTKAKKKGYRDFLLSLLGNFVFAVFLNLIWPRLDRCAFKKGVGQSFEQKCRLRMSSMHANEPT